MTPIQGATASPRRTNIAWRAVRTLGLIYAAWLVVLLFSQRSLMFPRGHVRARTAPKNNDVEIWRLPRPDGVTAEAWFVKTTARNPAPAIVLLHGNAMSASDWEEWAGELARAGFHVLIPEFRGYAGAAGIPTRAGLVSDLTAMLKRLRDDNRVVGGAITVYGRSIGGAIAAEAVASSLDRPPAAALILHTAPARVADFSWNYGAPGWLVRDRFDAETAVRALRGKIKISVIGHRQDEIIPFSHAERLARAAGVTCVALNGTHNEFADDADEQAFDDAFRAATEAAAVTDRITVK